MQQMEKLNMMKNVNLQIWIEPTEESVKIGKSSQSQEDRHFEK